MNSLTHPRTEEEIRRERAWRNRELPKVFWTPPACWAQLKEAGGSAPYEGYPLVAPYVPSTPIDDGPNPGEMELDWLAINREFS